MVKELETYIDDEDEDLELQLAFEKGLIKPGLNREVKQIKYPYINNVLGLERKRKQIALDLSWIEEPIVICEPAPLAPELALQLEAHEKSSIKNVVHDDFAKEMLFYRLGQAAVLECIPKLHQLGIPTKRPDDYLAEMAKSDEHMHKVRKKLKHEEVVQLRMEKVKKLRQLKKHGKKIQIEKKLQKEKDKKTMLDQLKKYRKGKINSLDFLDEEDDQPDAGGSIPSKKQVKRDAREQTKKKQTRKLGLNKMKGRWKRNTAKDLDTPLDSVGRKPRPSFVSKSRKQQPKQRRMGKDERTMMKRGKEGSKTNKR